MTRVAFSFTATNRVTLNPIFFTVALNKNIKLTVDTLDVRRFGLWRNDGGCSSTTVIFIWLSVDYLEKIETQLGKRVSSEPCEYSCLCPIMSTMHLSSKPLLSTRCSSISSSGWGSHLHLRPSWDSPGKSPDGDVPSSKSSTGVFACHCALVLLWACGAGLLMGLYDEPRKDIIWASPAVVSLCSFVGVQMDFCHTAESLTISILSFFQPNVVNLFFLNCPNHSQNKTLSDCLN